MGKWIHKLSNVNMEKKTADCAHCGPVSLMYGRRCENARKEYEQSSGRKAKLQKTRENRQYEDQGRYYKYDGGSFYISNKKRLQMLEEHGYFCDICTLELTLSSARLDHCHITGKIRGWLCNDCNTGIGFFRDNPQFLENAIKYLG